MPRHPDGVRRSVRAPLGLALVTLVAMTTVGGVAGAAPNRAHPRTVSSVSQPDIAGMQPPTQGVQKAHGFSKVKVSFLTGVLNGTPIFNGDFADPAVALGNLLYVYASATYTANIPVLEAGGADDQPSVYAGNALPNSSLPKWATTGPFEWAPSVWNHNGHFVMYYAVLTQAQHLCISVATASSATGPFVDNSTAPIVCPLSQGGAIDPDIFITSAGTPYLLWKSDGYGNGLPSYLYSQQLSPDGLQIAGPPNELLTSTQPWEGGNVEGPAMVEHDGVYWLFYSANNWKTSDYAIGLAKCATIAGPCVKPFDQPWLATGSPGVGLAEGPGGEDFFSFDGLTGMAYAAWLPGQETVPYGQRRLYADLLEYKDGVPALAPRPLAAALSELELFLSDAKLPNTLTAAFADVVRNSNGTLTSVRAPALKADAELTCHDLESKQSLPEISAALEHRGLSTYEALVLGSFSVGYDCNSEIAAAINLLIENVDHGS